MFNITHYQNIKTVFGKKKSFNSFKALTSYLSANSENVFEKKEHNSLFSLTFFQGKRLNHFALPTRMFGLDFDYQNNSIEKTIEVLNNLNCNWFLYTTHSHKTEHHKFRVIIELSEELQSQEENVLLFNHFNDLFRNYGIVLDEQCKNISRIWYLPCSSSFVSKCVIHKELEKEPYEITEPLEQALINQEIWKEYERKRTEEKRKILEKKKGSSKEKAKKRAVENFQRSHKGVYSFCHFLIAQVGLSEFEVKELYDTIVYIPTTGTKENEFKEAIKSIKRKGLI